MLSSINNWATAGNDPTSWSLGSMGFQASLQPYMSDLLLLKGVDYRFIKDMPGSGERTGHACFPGMLTGGFYQLLSYGNELRPRRWDLGRSVHRQPAPEERLQGARQPQSGDPGREHRPPLLGGAGQVVLPNTDPNQVFNLYFKG